MAIYCTADGTWGVDYRDEFGRRHRRIVGAKEAALVILGNIRETTHLTRHAVNNFAAGEALTLIDARDVYLAHQPISDTTRTHQAERMHQFILRAGVTAITHVTPKLLDQFMLERKNEVAPTTLAYEAGVLKRWFHWLAQEHYIISSPAQKLHDRQPLGKPAHVLTYQEERALWPELRNWTRLKIMIALDSGLRISEVHALRRNHIDLIAQTLSVHARPGTKTRKTRVLPLTHRLAEELARHCAHLAPDSLLFTFGGKPMKKGSDFVKKLWIRVQFHFRFHDLRHTFATRLAAVTPNPHVVRDALGHALTSFADPTLPSVTSRYVHPSMEEKRAAVLRMEEITLAALAQLDRHDEQTNQEAEEKHTDQDQKPEEGEDQTTAVNTVRKAFGLRTTKKGGTLEQTKNQ